MTVAATDAQSLPLRAEVALLLACARPLAETPTLPASLTEANIDWDELLRLAQRHKVIPLLYRHLNSLWPAAVPASFRDRLQNHFYLNTARNHSLAAELRRLLQLFAEQSIPVIPYKGPALAQQLYGDISQRQFSDLDLLIHRSDLARAATVLEADAYCRQHQLTRAQEAAFQRSECEHLFTRADKELHLDLHWQFVPKYFSLKLKAENFWPRLHQSDFEGQAILAFGPEDLLLVLAVHAAKEFWERLVWLCDLAQLISQHPRLDWQQLLKRAHDTGTRRMLLTSLALIRDLLGTALPAEIEQAIAADHATQTLVARIKHQLWRETDAPAGVARFVLPNHALEHWRARISFHLRLALTPSPEDWAFVRVPDQLHFLYRFIRPIRLARKYLRGRH